MEPPPQNAGFVRVWNTDSIYRDLRAELKQIIRGEIENFNVSVVKWGKFGGRGARKMKEGDRREREKSEVKKKREGEGRKD